MENVLVLLVVSTALTSLATEAMKNQINGTNIPNNLLAGIMSVIVSMFLGFGYMIVNHVTVTLDNLVFLIALVFLNWLCSMTSYDKVMQTLAQIAKFKG